MQWSDRASPAPAAATSAGGVEPGSTSSGPDGAPPRERSSSAPSRARPARPISLRIASIGVGTALTTLGLNADGTVEVPTDPMLAGWYRLGTRPGAQGSAVILGHVDSVDGPAVFARLGTLRPGDLVQVRLADGVSESFRVRSVRLYPNDEFPAHQVYATPGPRTLNLVTCGGSYDRARGGYQANLVVTTRLVRPAVRGRT
ncbi:MAG: class F sortase [Nocardioides sp.]